MIKIVNCALALAVASSLGFAGTSGTDWAGLDKDMSLASVQTKGGPDMGALIRASLDFSSDDGFVIGTPPNDEDLRGFRFEDAKLWAQGNVGKFMWRLSFDFGEIDGVPGNGASNGIGTASLEDAYAKWSCTDNFDVTMGMFKAPVSRSNSIARQNLLFIDRSLIGHQFDGYDAGLMVGGSFDHFCWDVAVQNGQDQASEDIALSGRAEYCFNDGAGNREGGYKMGEGTNGTVGIGYFDDGDLDKATAFVVDGSVSFARFTVMAEIANMDEDIAQLGFGNVTPGDDATPWCVAGSYALPGDEWEFALRYQDMDDTDSSSVLTGGVNWYHGGHNAKWQLNVSDYSSDDSTIEGTLFQLGLTLGSEN